MNKISTINSSCSNFLSWAIGLYGFESGYLGFASWIEISIQNQPSERTTYADSEAACKCLKERYETKQEDIILYGQSVGSGRTVDFAARLPRLRAIVLHSLILEDNRAGERVTVDSRKKNPANFALWKFNCRSYVTVDLQRKVNPSGTVHGHWKTWLAYRVQCHEYCLSGLLF